MDAPLVVAVMITGKHHERVPLAHVSKTAFQRQTYPNRQLLILNTAREPLTEELYPQENVFEIHRPAWGLTALGKLRNEALDIIEEKFGGLNPWVIQWDDDDWHHPTRIAIQMAAAQAAGGDCAVTLRNQIRYSFESDVAYVHVANEPQWGIHGTVLHPTTHLRYEQLPKHEDSRFLKLFPKVVVCENPASLYVRFSHGFNTFSSRHIMGSFAGRSEQWSLPEAETRELEQLLHEHYSFLSRR